MDNINDQQKENGNSAKKIDGICSELEGAIGAERLTRNASMKEHSSFRAGGNADLLIIPASLDELRQTLKILSEAKVPHIVIGNGSNLLIRDGGYRGAIVKIGKQLAGIKIDGENIEAEAGALLSGVAAFALEHELTGFEFASGIPGSLGGAVFMNAGAYGGEMKQVVSSVRVISKDGREEKIVSVDEMDYAYRKSALMETGELVLSATIHLSKGKRAEIAATMRELTTKRNEKQPVCFPSAGSFFKRPEGNFAGKLIQEAGLMGARVGGAAVSTLHAGFIINDGGASASDILELMKKVQDEVFSRTGIMLEPEVQIMGEELDGL